MFGQPKGRRGNDMRRWIVRAADEDFVERESFETFCEAMEYADKMSEIFGSWNVEVYEA